MVLGHDISKGRRTKDIKIAEDVSFNTMMLRGPTINGLRNAGFVKPSPIQLHGIPLGKCGFDLLLEAKSGTGKTAVFTVIALEKLDLYKGIQAIVVAPTREIASQISDVITTIGSEYKGLNVAVVMGGLPLKEDKEKFKENVHIVVGSPGRLRHLIRENIDISAVRLFVLDEADKLMESSFRSDINFIFSLLPKQKQVIMSSATYSEKTRLFINKYVQKAQHVCPDSTSALLGIAHKVTIVPHHSNIVKQTKHRYEELKKILNEKQFKQCLIFCNYQDRVSELHRMLSRDKWPVELLHGQQQQTDRLDALKTLQEYKCRILVSTDLAARGIDASNVDLVINFEPPFEWQTYLHRVGRAGRYGSYGTAVSIINSGKEITKFKETLGSTNIPFNMRDLWSDTPFNLNILEESSELNTIHETTSQATKEVIDCKSEDLLWKLLTTDSFENKVNNNNNNTQEICSFQGLCDSFKLSSEPNIETFSDLMHSFEANHNINNMDKWDYKLITVTKLPIECKKFWENVDDKSINIKIPNNDLENKDTLISRNYVSKDLVNINDDFMGKENVTFLSDTMVKDNNNMNILPSNEINISKDSIHNDTIQTVDKSFQSNNIKQLNVTKLKSIQEKAYAKLNVDNKTISNPKQRNEYIQSNMKLNGEIIDPTEQAMISAGLPIAFGKQMSTRNVSKHSNHIEQVCHNRKKETCNSITANVYKQHQKTDNPEQAVDEGLLKKITSLTFRDHSFHSKMKSRDNQSNRNKRPINQNSLSKPKQDSKSGIKNISSKKKYPSAFDYKYEASLHSDTEIATSCCSETSYVKQHASKSKNIHTSNNKSNSLNSTHKKIFNSESNRQQAQIRSQQFDHWYMQLKHRVRLIQYFLYVEEIRKF